MVPNKDKTLFRRSWPWWRWVLMGLIALALALSIYMGWHYLMGGSVIGCDGQSPCDQVLSSRWSTVAGVIPISGLAAGAYLALLVSCLFIGPATAAPVRRLAWCAMLVLVGAAAGSAVWFTIVQKWIIGAFCPYCMTTHIIGLLLAALVIWRALLQLDDNSTDVAMTDPAQTPEVRNAAMVQFVSPATPRRIIGPLPAIGLALVGLVLAGILAACQFVFTPAAVYRGGESQDNLPAIDPQSVPMVGAPDAKYVVNLFFDYKCSHCQQMHFMLDEAIRRYSGKLAFVLCPAPLSSQCNPYITRNVDEYKDSCEIARIGLAVWVAKPEAFPIFDRWMFSMETGDRWRPRSLDAAIAKAIELVGQAKLETARANPWIERYMQTSIRNFGQTGGKGVPKMVFGSHWVTPEPYDIDDLVIILHSGLHLPEISP